ncbi:hypothetical protein HHI36_016666, partial [Cryptolaemus montrouzieri]
DVKDKVNFLEEYLYEKYEPNVVRLSEHFLNSELIGDFVEERWFTESIFGRSILQHGGVAVLCKDNNFTVLDDVTSLSV